MNDFDIKLDLIVLMDKIDSLSAQTDNEKIKKIILKIVDFIGERLLEV